MKKQEFHIPVASAGQTVLDLLPDAAGLSKATVKKALDWGAVWVERDNAVVRTRRAKKNLRQGDIVHFYFN